MQAFLGATELIDTGARFLTEITWWGPRERGYTPMTFLRFTYRRGHEIRKTPLAAIPAFLSFWQRVRDPLCWRI